MRDKADGQLGRCLTPLLGKCAHPVVEPVGSKGMTMPTSTRTTYKGFRITTRWAELALSNRRGVTGFDAAFEVHPLAPGEESWQQFPKAVFATSDAAAANALAAAERSIDELAIRRKMRSPRPA